MRHWKTGRTDTTPERAEAWAQTPIEHLLVQVARMNDPQAGARFTDALLDADAAAHGATAVDGVPPSYRR